MALRDSTQVKWILRKVHYVSHVAQHPIHCLYLIAVSIEGHGLYAMAAAVLLIVSIPEIFL